MKSASLGQYIDDLCFYMDYFATKAAEAKTQFWPRLTSASAEVKEPLNFITPKMCAHAEYGP